MRVQPFSIPASPSLRARIRWVGVVLTLALLTLGAGRTSARVAPFPERPTAPQAPTVTIVDEDIVEDAVWTRAGSPYEVAFNSYGILVARGATLTVDPGVEVRFAHYASLIVEGTIKAIGTPTSPITFTGTTKTPGWWLFLAIEGYGAGEVAQGSVFRHVTVEYAQQNLFLYYATAHVSDCVLRHASETGLWAGYAQGTVVERCRIVDNGETGIENSSGGSILAANNWWGSATGPYHEDCNPAGTGDTVEDYYSDGVAFRPFLTAADQDVAPVTAGDALALALAPQRWFAPADGVTLIAVEATLRDGAGYPVAGRTVCLTSDLGSGGGCSSVTGPDGKAMAYVVSDEPGDATLTVSIQDRGLCEVVASAEIIVTFVEAEEDDLLPGSEAPYMNGAIAVDPMPIVQGVPSTVSVRLTNPNAFPILVDAVFGRAEFGIGLDLAPFASVQDRRIEANSEAVISVPWTPPESGHVCLRVAYAYTPAGLTAASVQAVSGGGQTNFSILPPSLGSPGPDDGAPPDDEEDPEDDDPESKPQMAQRAKEAMSAIDKAQTVLSATTSPGDIPGYAIPNAMFSAIIDFNLASWTKATEALTQDPPRQDYDTYAVAESFTFTPLVADPPTLTAARAEAGNLLMESMLDLTAELRAAALSLDRYTGASNADDLYWASEQAATLLYFEAQAGATMLEAADRIDGLLDVMVAEGIEDLVLDASTVITYQNRLAAVGFYPTEIDAAHSIGMSDDEIEAARQARIAADPMDLAGSVMTRLADVAARLRLLGPVMMVPPTFDETGDGMAATAIGARSTNLARVFVSRTPFRIGNPQSEAATVELRVRRLDLPSDWMASVSPAAVDLAPGEGVTGTITVRPGLPAVQGTQPRVAVEGYIDGELIGGVVVEVMVPRYAVGGLHQRVYLPLTLRH